MGHRWSWSRRLLLVAASPLLLAFIAESALRLALPRSAWDYRDSNEDWQTDARLGWVERPGLDDEGFRTNADGIAPGTAQRSRRDGVTRILFVGDSTVVGRFAPPAATVTAQLQQRLTSRGRTLEVLNAGVEAYSTDQVLLRMEQLLPLYHPDVVVYGFSEDDLEGNDAAQLAGMNKPRFTLASDGSVVPQPFTASPRVPRQRSGPRLWIQYSGLYRYLHARIANLRAKLGHWDGSNLVTGEALQPRVLEKLDWPLFQALLVRMRQVSAQAGAHFVFYGHPALEEVWDPTIDGLLRRLHLPREQYDARALERRLRQVAQQSATSFVPFVDAFLARRSEGPFHMLPFDPSCNAAGYGVEADLLAAFLIEQHWL
jgi:hypothetical protein